MPKKLCCCGKICKEGYPTSCCKAPSRSCSGKSVYIETDVYVKFYCNPLGQQLIWNCNNGTREPVNFETEKWRLKLTHTLNDDDTAPELPLQNVPNGTSPFDNPNILFVDDIQVYEVFSGVDVLGYVGANGAVGGMVDGIYYQNYTTNGGNFPFYSKCKKCVDVCDANEKLKGCVNISYVDALGVLHTNLCGLFVPTSTFPPQGYYEIVSCGDCCTTTPPWNTELIDYNNLNVETYHACDPCNEGNKFAGVRAGLAPLTGKFNIGSRATTVSSLFGSSFVVDNDISLLNSSWEFEFIPLYDGQEPKLNLQLLSAYLGCNQNQNAPILFEARFPVIGGENLLFGTSSTSTAVPVWINSPYPAAGGSINPGLCGYVDVIETTYFLPENTFEGIPAPITCPCGPLRCSTSPPPLPSCVNELTSGNPRSTILKNCSCSCGTAGSCHCFYHTSTDPWKQENARPHQLHIELGVGYRNTLSCGDSIEMDFWEQLYYTDPFSGIVQGIDRHINDINGELVSNPNWYSAFENGIGGEYSYYGQGMKISLVYTRNSIPYENYNYETHSNSNSNCFAENSATGKEYINYTADGHPSLGQYDSYYEGEYLLSQASVWTPNISGASVNYSGFTPGTPPPSSPVKLEDFYKCYPFRVPSLGTGVGLINFPAIPSSMGFNFLNRAPYAYDYSYGEIKATVTGL
jgi:hypothetical protein